MVELILKGVGFKAFIFNDILYLEIGFSHYIAIKVSTFCKAKKNRILTTPKMAKFIQSVCKPDPYKGRGIQFKDKIYKFKPGKKR